MVAPFARISTEGRPYPAPTADEEIVLRDLESRGWKGELARGHQNVPPGLPDLKAAKGASTIFVEVKRFSETATSVSFTGNQFPRHRALAEAGTACYLAFVVGRRVYYYLCSGPN